MTDFNSIVADILPGLVQLRHELHAHPEIRFQEQWTSDRISEFLAHAGIPHTRGHARGTGIVATVAGASATTVVLRADIDALEIGERTGAPYASQIAGRMHACGHDGHIACLCGAALALARLAETSPLPNTVKFVFQPGEELGAGGRYIVEEGLIDGASAAFALHAWPGLPVGVFALKSGPVMASADWFRITITGRGCHGADPAAGIDPVVVAAQIVIALQTIVSREIDPQNPAVVTIGKIESGAANNVIPETAVLEGSYRALDMRVRDHMTEAVGRISRSIAAAHRATAEVVFGDDYYIPLVNDAAMTDFARKTIVETLGPNAVVEIPRPAMASEDFAFYLEKVPGSFLVFGMGEAKPLHSPYFNFNDDAIPHAVRVLVALAMQFRG
ncbi:MAG: amidohydrolase [Candidatus Hydrogenedentes bacterium]|nr:amidohydrolase [Candidatus Hydrogenedentota bacterium]